MELRLFGSSKILAFNSQLAEEICVHSTSCIPVDQRKHGRRRVIVIRKNHTHLIHIKFGCWRETVTNRLHRLCLKVNYITKIFTFRSLSKLCFGVSCILFSNMLTARQDEHFIADISNDAHSKCLVSPRCASFCCVVLPIKV